MKIHFLGTGTSQGVPVIGSTHPVCLSKDPKDKRLRSSILIEKDGKIFLIDCGPDFRYQMLRGGYTRVDVILLTHEHNDHTAGLDDVRPINFMMQNTLPIYSLPRVLDKIKQRFAYFFSGERYPGAPDIILHGIEAGQTEFIGGVEILPLGVWHGNLFILGYRMGRFAYITDVSMLPEETLQKLEDLDLLVLNALRRTPRHPSHFTLSEALEIVTRLHPRQTYLTHISHLLGFHMEVVRALPTDVHLAYDGLNLIL
ncbi:MAG: MBL fold metallo-hydrolase [Flavobacteriales bacterium AspAUS03]